MRGTAILTLALAAALAAGGGPAAAQDAARGAPDLDARVESLLAQVLSASAGARTKALDALRGLGADAIPAILRRVGPDAAAPEFDAAVAALAAVDPDEALAHVETCRSEWGSLGFLVAPDDRKNRRVVDELVARLIDARRAEWSKPARLQPSLLDDSFRVPHWVEEPVRDALPSHLLWQDVPVRAAGKSLEIDVAGDGRFTTKADGARPLLVTVGPPERPRRVLVYRRLDRWFAAPPNLLRGTAGPGLPVEVLDVEGDGDFSGPADLVRFGDGGFRPLREGPFAWTPGGLVRFRIRRDADGFAISTLAEPEPRWLTRGTAAGMDALNAWRAAAGLAPHRVDRRRSAACGLHHDYWRRNGFSAHDEDPERAGWTAEGARAGKASSCSAQADGPGFVRVIGATVLHRASLLGRADEGVGFFSGEAGSLLWGGEISTVLRDAPLCVPGPGQSGAPTACEPEEPRPSSDPAFYDRARGYPVSATWGPLADTGTTNRRLEVFAAGSAKPLAGTTFSAENPYSDAYRAGYPDQSVVFVSDGALPGGTLFTARLTATTADGPAEFVWQFRTR